VVRNLELEIDRLDADKAPALTEADRERLMALGRDLIQAWESPGATPETRQENYSHSHLRGHRRRCQRHLGTHHPLAGLATHTRLTVKRNRAGQTRWTTDVEVVDLVCALARQMPDETIAAVLNRSGKSTGYGNSWTRGAYLLTAFVSIISPSTVMESAPTVAR